MTTDLTVRPIIIEHRRLDVTPAGFTPQAAVLVSPLLRTSGLLAAMSDEQARTFLALLTFVTSNGFIQVANHDLASALGLSLGKADTRLESLAALYYSGAPVAQRLARENRARVYTLSPPVVAHVEPSLPDEPETRRTARREDVIAASRARYSRPLAEVEAEIALQLGQHPEETADTPQGEARRRLRALGVLPSEVDELITHYPLDEITQQLDWLPERQPRNPARLIVAAIREHYEPPFGARMATASLEEPVPPVVAEPSAIDATVELVVPELPEESEYGQ